MTSGLLIFVVFSILPLIMGRGRVRIPILFWLGVVALIGFWVYFSERPKEKTELRSYEEAFRRNQARVTRIRSDEMVELEEEEDEGACYAFQLSDDRIVFISGQDYYPSTRFPNTDFSLVEIVGESKSLLEVLEKNGAKLKAKRNIPAKVKSELNVPDHLEIIQGRLDQLIKG